MVKMEESERSAGECGGVSGSSAEGWDGEERAPDGGLEEERCGSEAA